MLKQTLPIKVYYRTKWTAISTSICSLLYLISLNHLGFDFQVHFNLTVNTILDVALKVFKAYHLTAVCLLKCFFLCFLHIFVYSGVISNYWVGANCALASFFEKLKDVLFAVVSFA